MALDRLLPRIHTGGNVAGLGGRLVSRSDVESSLSRVSLDLPPAPPDRPSERLRRWWRSRGQREGLRYWLLFRGAPALVAYGLLFVLNGLIIGWRSAYDVNIGITSPAATASPALAWPLSIAGWLVAPGIAGAVAGYVVSSSIRSRRRKRIDNLFREHADG
ncbi:DUF6313 family protein [Micromonospora sp. SL4-19]|uniref:DUF6313 family protein n=1 Tax=Micromonospora sp. SL4-19 TaxID=3399129 RepID=UPI003A4D5B01